jgi:hypothetical protein
MIFVFPMVGRSSRFTAAGYTLPKYRLDLHGRTVFEWVLEGFRQHFKQGLFLFPHRDDSGVAEFICERVAALGIIRVQTVPIVGETLGQADSVLVALETAELSDSKEGLVIFNIDSFRPGFVLPMLPADSAGYLEVFRGAGEGWSFVEADSLLSGRVVRTTEKIRISELCCTGLYTFSSIALYVKYARRAKSSSSWQEHAKEFYVAPLYNDLIADGLTVHYDVVHEDRVLFCGIPAEYEALRLAGAGVLRSSFQRDGAE